MIDSVSASLTTQSPQGLPSAIARSQAEQLLNIPAQLLQQNIDQLKTQNGRADLLAVALEAQQLRASLPNFPLHITADVQGRFLIPGVPPGNYTVVIQREGFFGKPADEKGRPTDSVSIPLTVPPQGDVPPVEVSLLAGAVIQGVVRGADGNPISRASVQALPAGSPGATPQTAPVNLNPPQTVKTDELGEYRLFWLRPGDYAISATPPLAPVSLDVPGVMQPPAYVRTFFPDVADQADVVPLTLKSGDEFYRMDITLRTNTGGRPSSGSAAGTANGQTYRIRGQVVNNVMMLANTAGTVAPTTATLLLAPRNPNGPGTGVRTVGAVAISATSQTVAFDVSGIAPGSYDLFARMPDNAASAGRGPGRGLFAWGRAPVEITAADAENIVVTIHAPLAVNGRLTVDGLPPTSRDKEIRVEFEIAGVPAAFPNYQGANFGPQAPQANGQFTMPAVAEGTYSVNVTGLLEGSYIADVRSGGSSVFDSGFTVGAAAPETVEIQVATNGGTIEGILMGGPDKKPLAFTRVLLVPPAAHRRNTALFHNVMSDAQGRFKITGIRPDDYTLFAWESPATRFSLNDEFLAKYESQAASIRVQPGTATRVEVVAIPAN